MDSRERIQLFYLDNVEGPRNPGFATPARRALSALPKERTASPKLGRADSRTSTVSYASRRSSDVFSGQKLSSSSTATSVSTVPPWAFQTLNQQIATASFDYGYILPCEFFFIGCEVQFEPPLYEEWISHSASHLGATLPHKAICTFCDDADGVFESTGDTASNWRERMLHIGNHLQNLTPYQRMRPDYWVIGHMRENKLISKEDYQYAREGSERPPCNNMYPPDYELPEAQMQKERRERDQYESYDLADERRRKKKEVEKEKSKSAHRQSHSYRPR